MPLLIAAKNDKVRAGIVAALCFLSIVLCQVAPAYSAPAPSTSGRTPSPQMLEYMKSSKVLEDLGLQEWEEVTPPVLVDGVVHLIDGSGQDTVIPAPKYSPSPFFASFSNSGWAFMSENTDKYSTLYFEGSLYNSNGTTTSFDIDATGQGHIRSPLAIDFHGDDLHINRTSHDHASHNHGSRRVASIIRDEDQDLIEVSPGASLSSISADYDDEQEQRAMLTLFEDCYTNYLQKHKVDIGIAITYYAFKEWFGESVDRAEKGVSDLLAFVNYVFTGQLNVEFHVENLVIVTDEGGPAWNTGGSSECGLAETQLENFRNWQKPAEPYVALWHLLDLCGEGDGLPNDAAGIAYVGVMCPGGTWIGEYNAGLTRRVGASTSLILAHEMGHMMGMDHTFEEGQGSTGGIMDYGNAIPNGETEPQINEKYRKEEVCSHIQTYCVNGKDPAFNPITDNSPPTASPPTAPPSGSPTPSPTSSPQPDDTTSTANVSTTVIIAGAAGAGLVLLVVAGLLVSMSRRRRKHKREREKEAARERLDEFDRAASLSPRTLNVLRSFDGQQQGDQAER